MNPSTPTPTAGRFVTFTLDPVTVARINHRCNIEGGNFVAAGQVVPAMIVKVWPGNVVNLKLQLDAPFEEWVTSVQQFQNGTPAEHTWRWSEILNPGVTRE